MGVGRGRVSIGVVEEDGTSAGVVVVVVVSGTRPETVRGN